ncbi:hypothetical protein FSA03_13690 [Bacteroides fragilis]|uniref:Uncharacterized protein n=1 Tax=Bacteroides fragilis TaxID=817 RepID=A0AB38PN09_BACFG|nr:hypothetical protein F9Z90_11795 [Bacteroides fragilis]TWV40949.1 hypothetical protein FSA06_12335 [Bacteroides fragilis]TWV48439.1 hypothetical protein FSA03_13690 [Bacteroides fragilis]
MAHYRDKSCTISLSKILNCTLVYTETFLLSGINIVEWMPSTKNSKRLRASSDGTKNEGSELASFPTKAQ